MNALLSRKLIGSVAAMSHAVGPVLGLAAIRPRAGHAATAHRLLAECGTATAGADRGAAGRVGGGRVPAVGRGEGAVSVQTEAEAVAEAAWRAGMPPDAPALLWLVCWPGPVAPGWLLGFWAGGGPPGGRGEGGGRRET